MNRFRIHQGFEEAFEDIWKNRDTQLKDMEGFKDFHLLRGPFDKEAGTTLYASHTIWESEDAFTAWTKSDAFRQAHKGAGEASDMYVGHPNFEGFHTVKGA